MLQCRRWPRSTANSAERGAADKRTSLLAARGGAWAYVRYQTEPVIGSSTVGNRDANVPDRFRPAHSLYR